MGFKELTSVYVESNNLTTLEVQHRPLKMVDVANEVQHKHSTNTIDGKITTERKTLIIDGSALVFSLQQENEEDVAKYLSSITTSSTPSFITIPSQNNSSSSVTSQSSSSVTSSKSNTYTNRPYIFPINSMKLFHYPQVKQDKRTLGEICKMFKIAVNNYIWPLTDRSSPSNRLSTEGYSEIPEAIINLFRSGKIDSYTIQTLFSKSGHNMPTVPDVLFPYDGKTQLPPKMPEYRPLNRQEVKYTVTSIFPDNRSSTQSVTSIQKHILTRVPDCLSPGDFLAFRNKARVFLSAFDKCGINLLIILDGVNDPSKIDTHMERADKNANSIEEWMYNQKDPQTGEIKEYKNFNRGMPIPRYIRYVLIEEVNKFSNHRIRVADGEADPELTSALRSAGPHALGIWSTDSDCLVPRNDNPFFTVQGTTFDFEFHSQDHSPKVNDLELCSQHHPASTGDVEFHSQHHLSKSDCLSNDGIPFNWNCLTDQDIDLLINKSAITINLQYVKTDNLMRSLGLIPTKTEWEDLRKSSSKDIFPRYFSNFEASTDLWSRLENEWVWPIFAISLGNDYLNRPDIDSYFVEEAYSNPEAASKNRCIRLNYRLCQIRKLIQYVQRAYQNYKTRDTRRSLPKLAYTSSSLCLTSDSIRELSLFLKFLNEYSSDSVHQAAKNLAKEKRFAPIPKTISLSKSQFYPPMNKEYSSWSKLMDPDHLPYINLLTQIVGENKQYHRVNSHSAVNGEYHRNLIFNPKPQWECYEIKSIEEKESKDTTTCSTNIFDVLEDVTVQPTLNTYLDKYFGETSSEEKHNDLVLRCILYTYKELMHWAKASKASDKFIEASIEIPIRALVLQYLFLNKQSVQCSSIDLKSISSDSEVLNSSSSEVKFPSIPDSKNNLIFIPSSIWASFLFVTTYMRMKWLSEIYQSSVKSLETSVILSTNQDFDGKECSKFQRRESKKLNAEQNLSLKNISNIFDAPTFYGCYVQIQSQRSGQENDEFFAWLEKNYHN